MCPSISIHLYQSCSILFAPAALLSSDGRMTLSDLHTHTSSDKADTLKTHPDHSEGLSVSVQTLSPLSAHQLILFASNNETLLTAETGPDIMRPKKKRIRICERPPKWYTCTTRWPGYLENESLFLNWQWTIMVSMIHFAFERTEHLKPTKSYR